MGRRGLLGVRLSWSGEFCSFFIRYSIWDWWLRRGELISGGRFALYEDVVTNDTLAEQYRQYMLQYLGLQPEQMVPVKEARTVHDSLGSS